jgi:tetratricopeptide (TPR) repeat protein
MTHQTKGRSATDARKRPVFYRSLANVLALSLFSNLFPIAASAQVLGSEAGQPQQSAQVAAQETTGPQGGTVDEKDVRPLEQGHPVKRELSSGHRHLYRLKLSADQFLKATIEQQGIDVVVQISGPEGNPILESDSERRPQGQEQASMVAETAGDYRLVVRSKPKEMAAGSYEIRIEELRAATDDDRALHEAQKLFSEALRLRLAGKYDDALPLVQRALVIRERILGPNHRDVAAALNGLAVLYTFKGEYVKGESLSSRALLIREKALGPDHPDVAQSLNHLASLYVIKGDYVKAESFYERALLIVEKALGPDHPDVASPLNNLGGLYRDKGDYAKAEPLLQRALLIKERALGPDHRDVASSLNNLASLYRKKGDYMKAEPLFQRAVFIMEKVLGPDHPDVAAYLNNLANLYYEKGDYAKAEPLLQRALLIKEKALGPDHSDVADVLNNIALLYNDKGDYVNAVSLYKRSLLIKEKALGPDHPDVAPYFNNIANLYRATGNYAEAEPFLERALLIMQKVLGADHPDVARCLNNLANLYYEKGDNAKAETLYHRALLIKERALGPEHPDVARSLVNLALLCAAKGDLAQAVKFQSRANAIGEHNLSINLTVGSERQKLAYLALFFTIQTDFTLSLHSQAAPNDPQALDLAFTTLLRWKARGLDAMTDTIAALRRRAAPKDQELFDQLAEARSQLAALIFKEPDSTKPETYRTRIKPLEEKVENLEAELSARSAEFRAQSQPVTLSAIQSALPSGSALIEFVTYTPRVPQTGKSQPPRYLAYLLATQGRPKWVDLGEAAPIERAVEAWRQSLRENSVDVKQLGRAVDELVMRPVRSSLQSESGQIRRLLIAPDGSLNLIPFAAMVDEENRYLIERHTISYLTSGRDLLRLRNPQPSKSVPLVLANPLFGRMASAATRGSRNSVNSPSGDGAGDQGETRSDPARIFFRPLPGTEGEAPYAPS